MTNVIPQLHGLFKPLCLLLLLLRHRVACTIKVSLHKSVSDADLIRDQVQWVTLKGAYLNPKQEFRHADPGDPSSSRGVFATDRIPRGDVLSSIPWSAIIEGEPDPEQGAMACDLVDEMVHEMKLGERSTYAPYVQYLKAQPMGQIPSAWSAPGQSLLQAIVGENLPPNDAFGYIEHWHHYCKGERSLLAQHAAMLQIQRAEDNLMVPWYDMHSHRNGKWLNAHQRIYFGKKFDLVAGRDIEKGEQIYISYNQCPHCEGRMESWGTAENFRDYGFVEQMPQRWFFHEIDVAFDLDYTDSGDLEVTWLFDNDPSELIPEKVFWMRKELHRLEEIDEARPVKRPSNIPEREWDACWDYHDALVTALATSIKSARDIIVSDEYVPFKGCYPAENGTCYFSERRLKNMDAPISSTFEAGGLFSLDESEVEEEGEGQCGFDRNGEQICDGNSALAGEG